MRRQLWLLGAALAAAGCAPTYVNLTPERLPRVPTAVYPFEVQWESPRLGANNPGVRAYVLIQTQLYPMTRVPGTTNRWAADVPAPTGKAFVPYRYKFVYEYPGLPKTQTESSLSEEYYLTVAPAP